MKDKDKTKAELIKELKTLRKEREKSALDDITEHKQIEEKYPSFTNDILDASVVGKFILDSDFKVVWINHSIEKYFGLQREKVIGKDKRKLIKKNIQHIFEDPDEFIRRVFATYDNNTYIENFECHVLPDGKRNERWLEHWSQPIKSGLYAGGRIEHYYDITERKQAEETRQKTEDLFLINALNDAVNRGNSLLNILQLLARETKRIFSCYGATVYLLSEDRECLAMQTFTLPPATMSRAEKLIGMRIPAAISIPLKAGSLYRKVLQEGKPQLINDPKAIQGLMAEFTENKRLKKLIPKIYSILDTCSVINVPLVSKGEAIGLLDLSRKEPFTGFDLKRVETISRQLISIIERKQAEENLKESRHLLNATEVISKTGGWEVDIQSQKGTWTDEFYRIHEVPFDYDMNVEKGIAFYKPEDQPAIERYFKKAIEEGEPYDLELQFITAKGKHLWVRTIGSPVQKNGKTVKIIGNIQDITERKQAEEKLKNTLNATIETVSKIVEVKDPYTAGHQLRVSQLTTAIAKELNLSPDKVEGTRIASLIHDIGKISVPTEILSKSTTLSDIEFGLLKEHSRIGHDILKAIDFSYPVANIVLQHHEKINGSGYPGGLKGDEILLEAKIICVADVVEAMSSHRPYRPALGIDAALEEISQNKAILYDPKVVDPCLRLFKEKGFKFK